jgi:hypothetical protein
MTAAAFRLTLGGVGSCSLARALAAARLASAICWPASFSVASCAVARTALIVLEHVQTSIPPPAASTAACTRQAAMALLPAEDRRTALPALFRPRISLDATGSGTYSQHVPIRPVVNKNQAVTRPAGRWSR